MAEHKITTPLPPVEWDLPVRPDDSEKPENTSHPDRVAAHLKADEAARLRQGDERGLVERPRDVLTQHEKVEESAPYRSAPGDDDPARKARRTRREPKSSPRPQKAQPRRLGEQGEERLSKVELRLQSLVEDLNVLDGEFAAQLQDPSALTPERRTSFETRLYRLEMQLRYRLQMLIAGGTGLTLLADPRLTFKRLFDRLRRWPQRVRPGYRPETDEDFDTFLSWVFEPPAVPAHIAADP